MEVSETQLRPVKQPLRRRSIPKRRAARAILTLLGAGAFLAPARAAVQEPGLVLVESVPSETELAHEGWPRTADVWLDMIGGARESLDLAHFYASDEEGSRLEEVVRAIEAAAARGVRVRFLADAGFHATYPETLDRLGAREGIEVRKLDLKPLTGGVLHAKCMLVDGREAFLGSQNFDWRALEHIQELGLRIRLEPVARALLQVFESDWARAGGEEVPPDALDAAPFPVETRLEGGVVRVTPVFSPRPLLADEALWDLPRIEAAIDGARERVWVQLLSYKTVGYDGSYFDRLESALRRAAARGVEVRLLLADWCKRKWTVEGLQSLQALPRISVRLVTIPQHSKGFVPFARVAHAKYMVADGRVAWLGTGNWSGDYFFNSRNVGLMLEGDSIARLLEDYFRTGWDGPYAEEVDPCADYEPPRIGG